MFSIVCVMEQFGLMYSVYLNSETFLLKIVKKVNVFVTRFISFCLSSVIPLYHKSRYSFIW